MTNATLQELITGRISDLVDQMMIHQAHGNDLLVDLLDAEIKDLCEAIDSEDAADNFFYAAYHGTL